MSKERLFPFTASREKFPPLFVKNNSVRDGHKEIISEHDILFTIGIENRCVWKEKFRFSLNVGIFSLLN